MNAQPALIRFLAKVDRRGPDECWEWRAALGSHGYGHFSYRGTNQLAHRVAHQLFVGPIPDGLTIDHLCRNKLCVNPRHLEPVTHRENCLRSESPFTTNALKTHCIRGHPFDEANTITYAGSRDRKCRTCTRAAERARRAARKRGAA